VIPFPAPISFCVSFCAHCRRSDMMMTVLVFGKLMMTAALAQDTEYS
jgi:hypothetical protein